MVTTDERRGPMTETVSGMREIVHSQTRLVDECLHLLVQHRDGVAALSSGDETVLNVILPMVHMIGISGHSILRLTDEINFQVKDAYPIARSVIEGAVNVAYIMAKGGETAARAKRHAHAKSFRDLKREWDVAGVRIATGFSGEISDEDRTRLESLLPEFTTPKGHEKGWTDDSLKQRLAVVAAAFPNTAMIALNTAAFNIYRHASEVVHGSYFSAIYFWGLTSPERATPRTADDFRLTLLDHQFSVLISTILAMTGLVECFATYVDKPALTRSVAAGIARLRTLPAIHDPAREPAGS